jgi:fatty acid desaturase
MKLCDEDLAAALEPNWAGYGKWLVVTAVFGAGQAAMIFFLLEGWYWPVLPLMVALGILMHGHLMAFHEAAHRSLVPVGWWNDAVGIAVGILAFTSLSAYRELHRTHHAYLASERDEEMWPYVDPAAPRRLRRGFVRLSLFFGIAVMPFLCLRTFLRTGSPVRGGGRRLRIWLEYGLVAGFWILALGWTASADLWGLVAAAYLGPALVAGNIQGTRECIEHVGLTGRSILASTRSVVPEGLGGRILSALWFNIEYHGAHHLHGSIPQARLPGLAGLLTPSAPGEVAPFRRYRDAFAELVRCLDDPRVGEQWCGRPDRHV